MKKYYPIFIRVTLVILINLFFLILLKNVPASTSSETQLLASAISTICPNGTYLEQVEVAKNILNSSKNKNLQQELNQLGTFTNPITPASIQAAEEALIITQKSSK